MGESRAKRNVRLSSKQIKAFSVGLCLDEARTMLSRHGSSSFRSFREADSPKPARRKPGSDWIFCSFFAVVLDTGFKV